MPELTHVMHVLENRRSGVRGDVWSVQVDGVNIGNGSGDGPDRGTGDPADTGTVASWKEAQELAVTMNSRLEPPSPGLRREMVEAGVSREEFGESSSAALFSHPHGVPDI
jgi:hypothetical protein